MATAPVPENKSNTRVPNIPDYQQMISKLSTEKTKFLASFLKENSDWM